MDSASFVQLHLYINEVEAKILRTGEGGLLVRAPMQIRRGTQRPETITVKAQR